MSEEMDTAKLEVISEAWINALIDECARHTLTCGDVRTLLDATGKAMQGIAARYAPPNPSETFAWGYETHPTPVPVFVAHTPELAIGDVVRADLYRDNEVHEGKVKDIAVGKYLAQSVMEIDYLLELGHGRELWVGPGQIEGVKRGEEWAEYHQEGAR